MIAFAAVSAQVVTLAAGLAAVYLSVAMVMTLAQAHLGVAVGRAQALADLPERVIPIVVAFAVAVNAGELGRQAAALAGAGGDPLTLWQSLGLAVVKIIILSTGASLAAGIALGAFAGQIAVLTGRPDAAAMLGGRLALTALTAALTAAGLTVVEMVFQAVH